MNKYDVNHKQDGFYSSMAAYKVWLENALVVGCFNELDCASRVCFFYFVPDASGWSNIQDLSLDNSKKENF